MQVDLNLPERLGGHYVAEDGQKHNPVMLHRALFGSLERFTGILIEHYAGNLPLWLAPTQAVVAPITSDINEYAERVFLSLKKIPYQLILGKNEMEDNTVTLREFGNNKQEKIKFEKLNDFFQKKCMMPSHQ